MRGGLRGLVLLAAVAHAGDDLVARLRSDDWTTFSAAANEIRMLSPSETVRLAPDVLRVDAPLARTEILQALGRVGPAAAAPLVPDLVAACFDEDLGVRSQAAQTLGSLGPAAWRALSLLPDLPPECARAVRAGAGLPDGAITDPWAREAWRTLGRSLGEGTDPAALEEAFLHPHPYVQDRAAAELSRRGAAALPALGRVAGDPSVRVRRRAASALATMYQVEGAVPLLVARLDDADTIVRESALLGLGAAGAVEPLLAHAERAGPDTAGTTVDALERARPGSSLALLRRLLRSEEAGTRGMALARAGYLGKGGRPLLDDVIDMAFDEVWTIRDPAQRSLLVIGGTPDEVAPWLREIPDLKLEGVLAASKAELPRRIAAVATPADLAAALAGEDALAAGQAAAALGAFEPRSAGTADLLAAAFHHEKSYVRYKAAQALIAWGDLGVPALAKLLEDGSVRVRWRAIEALGSMGAAARAAVPALVEQLGGPTIGPACEALRKMGPAASAALPALLAILRADDDIRACTAMSVIAAIGKEAKPAIPLLVEALDRKERQGAATYALGAFGRDAHAAVPKLRRLVRESPPTWPDTNAFLALLRIGGEGHRAIAEMFLTQPHLARQARNYIRDLKVGSPELVETLVELARSGHESAPYARESLGSVPPTPDMGLENLVALAEVGGWANEAHGKALAECASVEELLEALPGTKGWGGWAIVVALGLKGKEAEAAAPAIVRCFLQSALSETRVVAAHTLVAIKGAEALPDLLAALKDRPAADVRVAIDKALAEVGDAKGLCLALSDQSIDVRAAAVRALGTIDPLPKEAVPPLVENFGSRELYVKGVERLLLARKEEALPLVAALLRENDTRLRARATALLGEMGRDALTYLVEELKDHDPLVRIGVLDALRRMGDVGRPEALRLLREDPHPDVRAAAMGVLFEKPIDEEAVKIALDDPENASLAVSRLYLGQPYPEVAAGYLVEALAHPIAREAALKALGRRTTKEALEALRRAAAEATGEAQAGAALALARTGEIHVEGLRAALRSGDRQTRVSASEFLATVGPEAAPAVPELAAILKEGDEPASRSGILALGSIGPRARDALPALRELADGDDTVARFAEVAVARIEGGVPELLAMIDAGKEDVVWESLAGSGQAALPELRGILEKGEGKAREGAAARLVKQRARAVPVAVELLGHENGEIRVKAAWILGKIGKPGIDAVPALVKALDDPDLKVRAQAAGALGAIGSEDALPALQKLRGDERTREIAEVAIAAIAGKR